MKLTVTRASKPNWHLVFPFALALSGYLTLAYYSRAPGRLPLGVWWGVQAIGWLGCAWFLRLARGRWPRTSWIIAGALAFRACGLWMTPSLEDDYQRYLWDGWRTIQDGSPYQHAPQEFFSLPEKRPPGIEEALNELNHPGLTTIYAPVTQLLFAISALLAPGSLFVLKLLLMLVDFALLLLLANWGGRAATWFYGWCPLVVTENAFHAHVEAWALLWLIAAWVCAKRDRYLMAGLVAGVAVGAKLFAALAVPFLAWRRLTMTGPAFLAALACIYLPFLLTGSGAEWPGLHAMASGFEFNSLGWSLLAQLCGASLARVVCWILFGVIAVTLFIAWARRGESLEKAPLADVFLAFFLLSPVLNPWYVVWLVPFVILTPSWRALALIVVVPLSYATGLNLGDSSLANYAQPAWVRSTEFAVILIAALVDLWTSGAREKTLVG